MEERLGQLMPFLISLALGLLVGVERQRAHGAEPKELPGGIRTYPLVALLGCASAWAGQRLGPTNQIVITLSFSALVVASYVLIAYRKGDHGMTTALASLLTFVFGVMAYHDQPILAGALAIATTTILSLRKPLHELADRIENEDLFAALKLGAVTLIVLPVLPDKNYGPPPLDVFNPFKIWLLVVLVAGVGFAGYVGTKLLGPGRGIVAAGALGGLVSSTAVTLSFSARSRIEPEFSRAYALGIAIAWVTMVVRVFVFVALANSSLVALVGPPLAASGVAGAIAAGVIFFHARRTPPPTVNLRNPFALASAFKVAGLISIVLVVARLAQHRFQHAGVLVAAGVAGTVDADAIALSVARLSASGEVAAETAASAALIASAANTIVKAGIASFAGAPALRRALAPVVFALLAAGAGAYALGR